MNFLHKNERSAINGEDEMNVKEEVRRLACKFPGFSECRLPYTYHHDMMRITFSDKYESRSDVAEAFRGYPDEHLYAVAMLHLIKTAEGDDILKIFSNDELNVLRELLIIGNKELYS